MICTKVLFIFIVGGELEEKLLVLIKSNDILSVLKKNTFYIY